MSDVVCPYGHEENGEGVVAGQKGKGSIGADYKNGKGYHGVSQRREGWRKVKEGYRGVLKKGWKDGRVRCKRRKGYRGGL